MQMDFLKLVAYRRLAYSPAVVANGYDISTSVWENEMGREIGSDASKTRPSLSAPESDLSAQNLF